MVSRTRQSITVLLVLREGVGPVDIESRGRPECQDQALAQGDEAAVPLMVFVGQTPDQAILLLESDEYPANHAVATLDQSDLPAP